MSFNPFRAAKYAPTKFAIDLGLERSFALLQKLGDPHLRLPPTIHVAGTNGKGSVIAFLRALAEGAGITAHVYS